MYFDFSYSSYFYAYYYLSNSNHGGVYGLITRYGIQRAAPFISAHIYIVVLVKEDLTASLAIHKLVIVNQPNREEGDFLHVIINPHYLVQVLQSFRSLGRKPKPG